MIIRDMIVPLTVAVFTFHATLARAQSALPADSALPPVGGLSRPGPQAAAPGVGDDCTNGLLPLRQEAEQRGAMIKAASDRHAAPDEACKLIGSFAQSEIKMIKYVESHAQQCGVQAQVRDQLKSGHRNTENMLKKVCDAAKQPHPYKGLQIANRLRLSGTPVVLKGLIIEGLIIEGLGNHKSLREERS